MQLADLDFYHVVMWYCGLRVIGFVINVLLFLLLKGIGCSIDRINFSF